MAVNLSPIWGAGAQLLDNSGNVLSGGKIYTYAAGTTTQVATYTDNTGFAANSNPIVLNSAGRVPYEIWLTDGQNYKFVLKDSNDVLIGTWDNLSGINSNFIAYTNQQEIQTATAGQTVFNLTTMNYLVGTNSLSVFVDGVNQYGPGAQYAYEETDSNTVTFASGLHVGAEVKFTSTQLQGAGAVDASQVSYLPPFIDSVATNVEDKLAQYISVKDFGAAGDGVIDDSTAFQNAANVGGNILVPTGTYRLASQVTLTSGCFLIGEGAGNSIIVADDDVNPLLFQDATVVDYTAAGISKLTIKGNGAAVRLVTVNNVWGFFADHCRVYGAPTVLRCFEIQRYSFECQINSCRITDMTESGIYLNKIGSEPPNGAMILNCDFSPEDSSTAGGYAIYDEAGNTRIIGNWFEYADPYGGTAIYSNGSPHIIGNNLSGGYEGNYAIRLQGTTNAIVTNNSLSSTGSSDTTISLDTCQNTVVSDNAFIIDFCSTVINVVSCTNTVIQGNTAKGIIGGLYDIDTFIYIGTGSQSTMVDNNIYYFAGTGVGKGIVIEDGSYFTNITNNSLGGFATGIECLSNASNFRVNLIDNFIFNTATSATITNPLDVYVKNNIGFVTESSGSSAIANGTTTITVTHGLAMTPSAKNITITPTNNSTNDPGTMYVTNITSTTFDVACRNNPGVSDATFSWHASISQ